MNAAQKCSTILPNGEKFLSAEQTPNLRTAMSKTIRVLIAEDHSIVREGLKILINADPQFEIVGMANDGTEAASMVESLKPDIVLMDLAMPGGNGLEATRSICTRANAPRVLVLSAYQDEESVADALASGAAGFMTKHSAATELLTAMREVCSGRPYYSTRIAAQMKRRARSGYISTRSSSKQSGVRLTRREHEVLVLIASGMGNKEIAYNLGISIKTIEKHRQQVMDKLGVHEVAGLTRYAINKGLVSAAPAADNSSNKVQQPITATQNA